MGALLGDSDMEKKEVFKKGMLGSLSDLFGSITRNKVSGYYKSGYGHNDAYYRNFGSAAEKETFANLICIHGEGGTFWRHVLERLIPETNASFLRELGRHGSD
jgi:hypothetical protein